jgi:hypothetical protein
MPARTKKVGFPRDTADGQKVARVRRLEGNVTPPTGSLRRTRENAVSERFAARSMAGWIAVVAIPSILASIVVPAQTATAQTGSAQTGSAQIASPQSITQSQKPSGTPIRSAAPIEFAMIQEDEVRSASDEPATLPLPRRFPTPRTPSGPQTSDSAKPSPIAKPSPLAKPSPSAKPSPLRDIGPRPADGKQAADAQKPAKKGDNDDQKKDDPKEDDEDESRRERIDEKPLREVSLDIRPTKGTVPPNAAAQYYRTSDVSRHPQNRGWGDEIYLMETPRFSHNPLYFEQPLRERGGIEKYPRLGPVIAGGRFLFDTLKLPYQATVDPHESLVRTPPRHHVGNPQAWRQQPTGTQLKGIAVQAAAFAAMIWIIP